MNYQKITDQKQLYGLVLQRMKYNLSWEVSEEESDSNWEGTDRSVKGITNEELLWGG